MRRVERSAEAELQEVVEAEHARLEPRLARVRARRGPSAEPAAEGFASITSGRMRPNRALGGMGGADPSCCRSVVRRSSHSRYRRNTTHDAEPFFTVSTYTVYGLHAGGRRPHACTRGVRCGTLGSGHALLIWARRVEGGDYCGDGHGRREEHREPAAVPD